MANSRHDLLLAVRTTFSTQPHTYYNSTTGAAHFSPSLPDLQCLLGTASIKQAPPTQVGTSLQPHKAYYTTQLVPSFTASQGVLRNPKSVRYSLPHKAYFVIPSTSLTASQDILQPGTSYTASQGTVCNPKWVHRSPPRKAYSIPKWVHHSLPLKAQFVTPSGYIDGCLARHTPYPQVGPLFTASQGILTTPSGYIIHCLARHTPHPKWCTSFTASQGILHTPGGYIIHCLARHTL